MVTLQTATPLSVGRDALTAGCKSRNQLLERGGASEKDNFPWFNDLDL